MLRFLSGLVGFEIRANFMIFLLLLNVVEEKPIDTNIHRFRLSPNALNEYRMEEVAIFKNVADTAS
jgi:hypothetical protein